MYTSKEGSVETALIVEQEEYLAISQKRGAKQLQCLTSSVSPLISPSLELDEYSKEAIHAFRVKQFIIKK